MNKYHELALTLFLSTISTASIAETFNYTFVSANYEIFSENIDGIPEDLEGNGINLHFSFNITSNLAITGGYGTGSADVTSGGTTVDVEIDAAGIGFLYHTPINELADFVAGVDFANADIALKVNGAPLPNEDANGNTIFAGIKTMATDKVELRGIIERTEIDGDSSSDFNLEASFYIDNLFSLDAGFYFSNDGNSMLFGATKYF